MLFSSMIFLWIFLPTVLIVNYFLTVLKISKEQKTELKNGWLLLASLFFYGWGGIYYLAIMLSVIAVSYAAGILMERTQSDGAHKAVLTASLAVCLAVLFVFKYANMVAEMLHAQNWTEIALPIGISFFTFQAMSYIIDVYRREVPPQKNLLDFALYVSLFPQLVAGPIVKYSDINEQIAGRDENLEKFYGGQRRFCYGLAKKVLIANVCAQVADSIWSGDIGNMGAAIAWLGALAYTLQIYYDFSGYSDMAIGIGRMLGFSFKENFNYPYMSLSVREFWRRWHMSLSGWFRDYVYIPLGGSRKGMVRTCINIMIVFALTGIWHGANVTFLLWGMLYGVVLVIERLLKLKDGGTFPEKLIRYLYTMAVVVLGWILFRSDNIGQAAEYIGQLFKPSNTYMKPESYLSMKSIIAIAGGIVFMGPAQKITEKYVKKYDDSKLLAITDLAVQMLLLAASILMLVSGTYNPFIYFAF